MPILEFLSAMISAIAGAVTNGVIKLFRGRRQTAASPPPPSIAPPQQVLVVAPFALVNLQFPLNSEVRDILEIPRSGVVYPKPRLILPGQGVVSPERFIEDVADTLVLRAGSKIECARCHQPRHLGAFANANWVCQDCFRKYLSRLAIGQSEIPSGALWPSRSWNEITHLLTGGQAVDPIAADPTINALIEASADHSVEVRFNDVWIEHNIEHVDGLAMEIHASFEIDGARGRQCRVMAHFYFEDGDRLRDFNGLYRTSHGYAGSSDTFCPSYDSSVYENYVLYMPYSELHLENGSYDLQSRVRVFCPGVRLLTFDSDWVAFRYDD